MSERIFVVGAGKVGRGLVRAFRFSGIEVVGLHARIPTEDATTYGDFPEDLSDANVILIAVSDSQIDPVLSRFIENIQSKKNWIRSGTVFLHTSGSVDPESFASLQRLGMATGTFHPLIPFATPEQGASMLSDAWIGIDGSPGAQAASRRISGALGARTVNIPAGSKVAYHAAAVIASNFPIVLAAVASRVLSDRGVPQHAAENVVSSLMRSAVDNLRLGSPSEVLTGPAARGDTDTIRRHQMALRSDPASVEELYALLTRIVTDL